MENKLVSREDLKHFHTSLMGNHEDPKELLNIKQEVFKELSLSAPEMITPQLAEDVFASTLIPSNFTDTGVVVLDEGGTRQRKKTYTFNNMSAGKSEVK